MKGCTNFGRYVLLIGIIAFFSACKKVIGTGPTISEVRNVDGFDKISLAIDATVKLTQDSIFKVEVVAQQNILHELVTKVSGSTLIIMYQPVTAVIGKDVVIHISMPAIRDLNVSGSGAIQLQMGMLANDLDMHVSGSGKIQIPSVEAAHITTGISGSGEISIQSGTATQISSTISGSGDLDALNVQAHHVNTQTSGSGTTRVYATQTLFAEISGSGNVYYRGNPSVDSKISGSGKLIKQ
ncbi:MAG: DUF2807 domain-containing protein [Bacteroidetes bacterium]|nr:DUF2807 domain-containing protein [Bacteroidota bacterium]